MINARDVKAEVQLTLGLLVTTSYLRLVALLARGHPKNVKGFFLMYIKQPYQTQDLTCKNASKYFCTQYLDISPFFREAI